MMSLSILLPTAKNRKESFKKEGLSLTLLKNYSLIPVTALMLVDAS